MKALIRSILLAVIFSTHEAGLGAQAVPPGTGSIRGFVVDARDGTGLERVSVRVQETNQTTVTGADGRFELNDVPAGSHELYVSAVDFILVRRQVNVEAGSVLDLTIPIAAGTGTYAETITVDASGGAQGEAGTQQTLRSGELQQLRGLVTNDPFRAIQVLPGVASTDELRSEFSVRGSPMGHMSLTFEGIATPLLVHTVQGVQDTGSIAMINGDVLQEITLAAGSYPQRFGNRTGPELGFRMREGSREGVRGHVGVSVTDASVVVEGPLGRARRGSWLASLRKSYLDLIIRRLDPTNSFGFGFSDVQSKLVYDVSSRHQVQFAFSAGRSRLDQVPETLGIDDVLEGRNRLGVAVLTWRDLVSPRLVLTHKISLAGNSFSNTNVEGLEIARGAMSDLLYRIDWSHASRANLLVEGGGEVRRLNASTFEQGLGFAGPQFETRERFDATATATSAYLLARFTKGSASIVPGVRVDHSTLTGHSSVSPWLEARWPLAPSVSLHAGAGIYRQEPGFAEVKGLRGADLATLRAYHADVGIEGRLEASSVWRVALYNREDRGFPRLPDSEFRTEDGLLVLPSFTTRYRSSIDGYSRGLELLLQRRTPNGVSGWVGYNLAFTNYRDTQSSETFWGNDDQRHTLNVYGIYRLSDRTSVSARFRAGSNFPAPGYYESRGQEQYFLSAERNVVRVPVYSRLDIRANRTFTWQQRRLTLFLEVLNLYGRRNVRAVSPRINGRTLEVFDLFDTMFPRIPSAGLLLEF